ncbi:DUF2384 domain-containing protein [Patescibacteria group bacterium]|nr:DUF2384 domain-containing protein [Patescibacteria group bacterium]
MTEKTIAQRINVLLRFYQVSPRILGKILGVSESTVRRWKKGKNVSRAHRLFTFHKLEKIISESHGVLKRDRIGKWLNRKNAYLGDISPISCMIERSEGSDQVLTLINAIKYGIYL